MERTQNYWERMGRNRLSRRALLRASGRAGVGAAGLALVGCGDDDDDAQSTGQADQQVQQEAPEEQPQQQQAVGQRRYGGNYTVAQLEAWDGFDPHRAALALPFQVFNDTLMRLVEIYDNQGPILGAAIASLPEIPDDETYIFNFDQGARFWDRYPTEGGRMFTADDAAANIERQIDALDANGAPDARLVRAGLYQTTASVDATDEQTLILKTPGPDATYLESVHMAYSFMTSPEAIQLWDQQWIDEQFNPELSSGVGPFIPTEYEVGSHIQLERNPNFWKTLDGQQMPFLDGVRHQLINDATAIETAYRNGELDATSLNAVAIAGIAEDFPDHIRYDRGVVLPLAMVFNYNAEWADNPWLDRRVPYAWHLAMDRDAILDFAYLGRGKPSVQQHLCWYHAWSPSDEEIRQLPGYRPIKDDDIAEARRLMEAAGVEPGTTYEMIVSDVLEFFYPGISEFYTNMFTTALDVDVQIQVATYDSITQQLIGGQFPGSFPNWVGGNTGDPTGRWNNRLVFGASGNPEQYNFAPVEEIVKRMKVTLDSEMRREMAHEVVNILLGEDERYGLDGFTAYSVTGNGIDTGIYHPYVNFPEHAFNVWENEGWHWRRETWMDNTHPDFPGARA